MSDPNAKHPRTFQCRDVLWEAIEQMSGELECSVDYLVNEALKVYVRQRGTRLPVVMRLREEPASPPPGLQPQQPVPLPPPSRVVATPPPGHFGPPTPMQPMTPLSPIGSSPSSASQEGATVRPAPGASSPHTQRPSVHPAPFAAPGPGSSAPPLPQRTPSASQPAGMAPPFKPGASQPAGMAPPFKPGASQPAGMPPGMQPPVGTPPPLPSMRGMDRASSPNVISSPPGMSASFTPPPQHYPGMTPAPPQGLGAPLPPPIPSAAQSAPPPPAPSHAAPSHTAPSHAAPSHAAPSHTAPSYVVPPPPSSNTTEPSSSAALTPPLYAYYAGQRYHVDKDRFIIGRGRQAVDLTIKDPNISRQHAMVEYHEGQYFIVDMGSTNGIEHNGQRITRKPVVEGDLVRICDHEVRFTYH